MVTVASFSKPEEAHLARMRLEASGIPAFIRDENMVQTNWLYSNAIGGVRLQVAEEDLAEAQSLLSEECVILEEMEEAETLHCPVCHSEEVEADQRRERLAYLSILLVGFPVTNSRKRYHCRKCNHRWSEAF